MSSRRAIGRVFCCAALLLGTAGLASAQQPPARKVDLQLVLAVDVSGSVNETRFELQKQGYAAAFRNSAVLDAIRSGTNQAIAVTMVQWTGPALHLQVVPWMRVGDKKSAAALADAIAGARRRLFSGGTSISGAIDFAMTLWRTSPYQSTRKVIDVSGDGANNRGGSASMARDQAIAAGIGINGLPILSLDPDLDHYYRDNVIGGPGAFVVAVKSDDDFAPAILRKLVMEISMRAGNIFRHRPAGGDISRTIWRPGA